MFSLIITIIAVFLVALLALATIYYGGSSLNKGSDSATTAEAVNKGNQIQGAFELYRADHGSLPVGTADEIKATLISSNYLKSWPEGKNSTTSQWSLINDYATLSGLSQSQCEAINQQMLGSPTIPACSATGNEGKSYCCSE